MKDLGGATQTAALMAHQWLGHMLEALQAAEHDAEVPAFLRGEATRIGGED